MVRPFISYQWSNRKFVEKVAGLLATDHNMDPILDVWEFCPGDSLIKSMESSIDDSTAFVIFWSEHAVSSKFVDYERELGLQKKHDDPNYRFLCVQLDETPPPKEHSFRLRVAWKSGHSHGKIFKQKLEELARAIQGLPAKKKPKKIHKNLLEEITGLWEKGKKFSKIDTLDEILQHPQREISVDQAKILIANAVHYRERPIYWDYEYDELDDLGIDVKELGDPEEYANDIERIAQAMQFARFGGISKVYVVLFETLFLFEEWTDQRQVGRFFQHALFGYDGDPNKNFFVSPSDISKFFLGYTIRPEDYFPPIVKHRVVPKKGELKDIRNRCQQMIKEIKDKQSELYKIATGLSEIIRVYNLPFEEKERLAEQYKEDETGD